MSTLLWARDDLFFCSILRGLSVLSSPASPVSPTLSSNMELTEFLAERDQNELPSLVFLSSDDSNTTDAFLDSFFLTPTPTSLTSSCSTVLLSCCCSVVDAAKIFHIYWLINDQSCQIESTHDMNKRLISQRPCLVISDCSLQQQIEMASNIAWICITHWTNIHQ